MNCQDCIYYRYETDTNFEYCIKTPFDEERMSLVHCPDYYNDAHWSVIDTIPPIYGSHLPPKTLQILPNPAFSEALPNPCGNLDRNIAAHNEIVK